MNIYKKTNPTFNYEKLKNWYFLAMVALAYLNLIVFLFEKISNSTF